MGGPYLTYTETSYEVMPVVAAPLDLTPIKLHYKGLCHLSLALFKLLEN